MCGSGETVVICHRLPIKSRRLNRRCQGRYSWSLCDPNRSPSAFRKFRGGFARGHRIVVPANRGTKRFVAEEFTSANTSARDNTLFKEEKGGRMDCGECIFSNGFGEFSNCLGNCSNWGPNRRETIRKEKIKSCQARLKRFWVILQLQKPF